MRSKTLPSRASNGGSSESGLSRPPILSVINWTKCEGNPCAADQRDWARGGASCRTARIVQAIRNPIEARQSSVKENGYRCAERN